MRIIILRSNPVLPDPRVEKEANTLLSDGNKVKVLAWNRQVGTNNAKRGTIRLDNGVLPIRWFNIKSSFGGGLKNLFPLIVFQICLITWLFKHRKTYDVIHACDFDTVIPAWICSVLFNKKYVYDIFDYYVDAFYVPKIIKPLIEKIDIFMINSANAVVIANESRKDQISKSNPKQLYIIHNSPQTSIEAEIDNNNILLNKTNKPKFVYIGILSDGRLLKEILEVFKEHSEWELHIGGFGLLEDQVREIAEKCQNIFFYGTVPYAKALKIELECDVLFAVYDPKIQNHRFSSPNKLYEAMMLGKPIIVAKNTGIDKIVDSENIGISINYSKADFEGAIKDLLANKNCFKSISKKTKELYKNEYSWDIMSQRLLTMYKNL